MFHLNQRPLRLGIALGAMNQAPDMLASPFHRLPNPPTSAMTHFLCLALGVALERAVNRGAPRE